MSLMRNRAIEAIEAANLGERQPTQHLPAAIALALLDIADAIREHTKAQRVRK